MPDSSGSAGLMPTSSNETTVSVRRSRNVSLNLDTVDNVHRAGVDQIARAVIQRRAADEIGDGVEIEITGRTRPAEEIIRVFGE